MKALLYRHLQLTLAAFAILLMIALGMLCALSWRNLQRIDMIRHSVERTHALQSAGLDMRHLQVADLTGTATLRQDALSDIGETIARLAQPGVLLVADNSVRLKQVEQMLAGGAAAPRKRLAAALELLRQTSYAETDAVSRMLQASERDAEAESSVSFGALAVLPALLLITLWLLRRRVFNPIDSLSELLSRLAKGEMTPIPVKQVDPLLLPLFNNYNSMIGRLAELEQARRAHAETLQAEVRAATQALLEQHRSLARAERLAAAGEVAASVAHELRNPLAGIQMALANLRCDVGDAAAVERLDLVVAELDRVSRLLNGLLVQAHTAPESARMLDLGQLVHELLALVRYQAPSQIALSANVADNFRCVLPEGQLRQALLNLVLNAIQALASQPGSVVVTAERAADTLKISVSDDGPGFPAEFLSQRIQAFKTGRSSGTGLGLAMVNRFARDLGGTLELSNRQPNGGCAVLVLPCGNSN